MQTVVKLWVEDQLKEAQTFIEKMNYLKQSHACPLCGHITLRRQALGSALYISPLEVFPGRQDSMPILPQWNLGNKPSYFKNS